MQAILIPTTNGEQEGTLMLPTNCHASRRCAPVGRYLLLFLVLLISAGLSLSAGCGGPPPPKKPPKAKKKKKKPRKIKPAKPDTVPEVCAPHDAELAEAFSSYLDAFTNVGHEVSPDGKTLSSAYFDQNIRIWRQSKIRHGMLEKEPSFDKLEGHGHPRDTGRGTAARRT